MDTLKVGSTTDVRSLAGAIAKMVRNEGHAEMQAIGAAAVNQATKAVAIARDFLRNDGLDITLQPRFGQVTIDGAIKTTIVLDVEGQRL